MARVVAQLTAPSHWAAFLINGDKDYLELLELKACYDWLRRNNLNTPSTCEDAGFLTRHSAFNEYPYASNCQEYTFLSTD